MAEFGTDPGDRSVTELEREVDRERERVSATIDELKWRASVGNIVDQLVKAVGENGGEVSRNLGRSLRDNPLAALLTGVGLAWLMAGSGRPREQGRDWDDPDRAHLRYGPDRFAEPSTFGVSQSVAALTQARLVVRRPRSCIRRATRPPGARGRCRRQDRRSGLRSRGGPPGSRLRLRARGGDSHRAGQRLREAGGSVRHRAGAARRALPGTGRDMRHGLDS